MSRIVETEHVRLRESDAQTPDDTVAIVETEGALVAETIVDVDRLRQALIAYQRELGGGTDAHVTIETVERDDGSTVEVLALQNGERATRAAALATKVPWDWGDEV